MCIPAAAAMAAVLAAQTTAGYASTRRRANANDRIIESDPAFQDEALDAQSEQVDKRAKDEMSERARAAQMERGRLIAINAESGLSGNSADRILAESYFNEGEAIAAIDSNRAATQEQVARERKAARINAARETAGVQRPSLLGAGLQIAGAYYGYKATQEKRKK